MLFQHFAKSLLADVSLPLLPEVSASKSQSIANPCKRVSDSFAICRQATEDKMPSILDNNIPLSPRTLFKCYM